MQIYRYYLCPSKEIELQYCFHFKNVYSIYTRYYICPACMLTQSCPTLCNSMNYSLPGSSVHGIFQARILEWVAIPSPENLPNSRIKPASPALQADFLPSEP